MSNQWDERYGAGEYVYGQEPNDFLVSVAGRIPRGKVLSLADGQGRNGVYLAGLGHQVAGVDSSAIGLEMARQLALERGVRIETIVADLADFDLGRECWDGIVSIFCHLPPPVRKDLLRRVVAALRPGGVFIMEAYSPAQLNFGTGGPSSVELLVPLSELKNELAGLRLDHAVEVERTVIEGKLHSGRAAVVQIVATKAGD